MFYEDKKRPLGRLSGLYTSMYRIVTVIKCQLSPTAFLESLSRIEGGIRNRKVFLDGSVLKDSLIADPVIKGF
jgi:hypothetical protein